MMPASRTSLAAAQGIVRGTLLGLALWVLLVLLLREVVS